MKKFLAIMLIMIMTISVAACGGGSGGDTGNEKAEGGLTDGYWVLEKMEMEGSEFSGKEIEELFGPVDSVMAVKFNEDMTFSGVFFEDVFMGTYTEAEGNIEMSFFGEKMKATYSGDTVVIAEEDGSFTLKNQKEMPDAIANNAWATYAPNFNTDETCQMSNFMARGWYYVEDNVLYGLTHSKTSEGSFAATPFTVEGDFPEYGEVKNLDDKVASYICKDGDYLYYIKGDEKICRIKPDGSDAKVIYEGACDYLQIHEGRLYFTDADYRFVSADMDGGNVTTVIDKEVYYPYFICGDWMIFQDDADNESLHLYNAKFGDELNISNAPSYSPVLDGKYLYFVQKTDGTGHLCRVDMSNPDEFVIESSDKTLAISEIAIDHRFIYTANENTVMKEDWKTLSNENGKYTRAQIYVGKDYAIHHEYNDAENINAKYMFYVPTGGGRTFR